MPSGEMLVLWVKAMFKQLLTIPKAYRPHMLAIVFVQVVAVAVVRV